MLKYVTVGLYYEALFFLSPESNKRKKMADKPQSFFLDANKLTALPGTVTNHFSFC